MNFCIMHFASSLLRFFFNNFTSRICVWSTIGAIQMLFHHLVDNSIIYKKNFYIGQILFSENKIIRSVVCGKVDGQILLVPGVKNQKFYLVPGMRNGIIYLVPNDSYKDIYLAIKWLWVWLNLTVLRVYLQLTVVSGLVSAPSHHGSGRSSGTPQQERIWFSYETSQLSRVLFQLWDLETVKGLKLSFMCPAMGPRGWQGTDRVPSAQWTYQLYPVSSK